MRPQRRFMSALSNSAPVGQFKTFLQNCPLAIVGLQPDGIVSLWNPSAEKLFGWTAQEAVGRPLPTVPPAAIATAVELNLHYSSPEGSEIARHHKDGSLVHVNFWSAPFLDGHGQIQASLALFADVTERTEERFQLVETARAAKEQIRDMDRFRELLEAAPDAIIEVDDKGKILLLNATTEKMFGYTRDEILGQSVDILVPEELRRMHEKQRTQYTAHPKMRPMGSGLQLHGRRKDGSWFPIEISLSPVKSSIGTRISAIVRDVSERRRAEERLQDVRDKFTAELAEANRELELRNREIERANRLKSEFLASMSHELRTPLHTIVGFSELLAEELDGPLNTKQKRFIGHIRKDAFHLLELINDILDLSKIEADKLDLHAEVFDATSALSEVLSSITPLARVKSIDVAQSVSASLLVRADRVRFKQILYNLLSNSVKFTPADGHISIAGSIEGANAQFSVVDTGIGIPAAEQTAIFEKFHQVGSTTKGVREGTGLGLAITKHLVERQGGRIWVESREGHGSRFTFTVPVSAEN